MTLTTTAYAKFHAAATRLFSTEAAKTAEVLALQTVRAGALGRLDLVTWKIKGQKNRYFVTVEGSLKANSFASHMLAEDASAGCADWLFERDYAKTLLGVTAEVADLADRCAKLQLTADKQAKYPNYYPGDQHRHRLEYFANYWGQETA